MEILHNYLVVGAVLFVLGAIGFLTRRNLIIMFLSAELMLQGVTLNFVAFSRFHSNMQGQSFAIFLLTIAACEAAIALALVIVLYHRRRTLEVRVWNELGEVAPPIEEPDTFHENLPEADEPRLTPSGKEPMLVGEKVVKHV